MYQALDQRLVPAPRPSRRERTVVPEQRQGSLMPSALSCYVEYRLCGWIAGQPHVIGQRGVHDVHRALSQLQWPPLTKVKRTEFVARARSEPYPFGERERAVVIEARSFP